MNEPTLSPSNILWRMLAIFDASAYPHPACKSNPTRSGIWTVSVSTTVRQLFNRMT